VGKKPKESTPDHGARRATTTRIALDVLPDTNPLTGRPRVHPAAPVFVDGYSAGTPTIISQVGRASGPSASTPLGGYFNTATMQDLRRRCTAPMFSGEVREWGTFVDEWEQYSRLYTIGLPEDVKLDLFKTCLPERMQKTVLLYQRRHPDISFGDVFERFQADYGLDNPYDAREKWLNNRLVLPKSGKLDLTAFLHWQMSHEWLREQVPDFSQHEEYQLVLKNLPEWGRRQVQTQEKKIRKSSFWIRFSGMTATKRDIKDLLEPLLPADTKLSTIRVLSNSAEIETKKEAHHNALLRVHGRTCNGHRLSLVETKFRLPVNEIFTLLLEELRTHEADSALRSSVTGGHQQPKTVARTEQRQKKPAKSETRSQPQETTPASRAPPQHDDETQVRAAASNPPKSSATKTWPDPDPAIAFTPAAGFKGCWWCHRRHLPADHDHITCGLRKRAAAFYKEMLAKGKPAPTHAGPPPRA
jgi:hypothetical protein